VKAFQIAEMRANFEADNLQLADIPESIGPLVKSV